MCIIGRYSSLILIVDLCLNAAEFIGDGCERAACVLKYSTRSHLSAHKCGGLDVGSKSVYVGVFCTLGLHRDEKPAQERLIERDLREMAEVSMLGHAGTGLCWAVKTSRRSRTAVYYVPTCTCGLCVCVGVCICAPGVITYRLYVLSLCTYASRGDAGMGSRNSPSLLTAIRLKSWCMKRHALHSISPGR